MPHDIVSVPVLRTAARSESWRETAARARAAKETAAAFPFDKDPTGGMDPPAGMSGSGRWGADPGPAAFIAQQLAQEPSPSQASGPAQADGRRPGTARAIFGPDSYQLAESRDPIMRGDPILFRLSV